MQSICGQNTIKQFFDNYFQAPVRDLLTQKSNLFVGVRISNWKPSNFCTKKYEIVPKKTAPLEF